MGRSIGGNQMGKKLGDARKPLRVGRTYPERTAAFGVSLGFWATGGLGIVLGFWRLAASAHLVLHRHLGNPRVLGAVHLFTLAGFSMLMMGALYQLVPVLLNCPPVRTRSALGQWLLYVIGLTGMIGGLSDDQGTWIALGGLGVVGGSGWFLANLGRLILRRRTWNITAWFFSCALGYLALTLMLGGLLVIRLEAHGPSFSHVLALHLVVALGGWFGLLMMGVSYRLWAMFGRRHQEPQRWKATLGLANAAIIAMGIGYAGSSHLLVWLGWVCQAAAVLTYVVDLRAAGWNDRRTMADPALRTQILATLFLAVFEAFGTEALRTHQPSFWVLAILAYGLGWLGLSFIAFIHKILPFLVWLHRYAHSGGSSKRPRLDDIWDPKTVYLPALASAIGLTTMMAGWSARDQEVWMVGIGLQWFAWIALTIGGLRAARGPHRTRQGGT